VSTTNILEFLLNIVALNYSPHSLKALINFKCEHFIVLDDEKSDTTDDEDIFSDKFSSNSTHKKGRD